jgi:tripartite-type tricarboxylate transporter receptor subunit TctC
MNDVSRFSFIRSGLIRLGGLALLAASMSVPALAADPYPNKPIKMIIPWGPGGGNDIIGRYLADKLALAVQQPVVVENRAGQSGVIGAEAVARSAPDGYTIMVHSVTSNNSNASVYPKMPYDTKKAFAPIMLIASSPHVIVVNPSVPANNLKEFLAYVKARPNQVSYASFGTGSSSHLTGALFTDQTGTQMIHVPYKSSAPAMTDTLAGHVPVYFATVASAVEYVKSGRLRALAVTGATRSKQMPDIPTVDEAAGTHGFVSEAMYGIYAPAGVPADIIARLNREFAKILATPESNEKLLSLGTNGAVSSTPEQMASYIDGDLRKWSKIVKDAGIKPE